MLTVGITEMVDTDKECTAQDRNQTQAEKHIYSYYIEYGKQDEQCDQSYREVADVLRLEPFELNGLIDAFVYFVYA